MQPVRIGCSGWSYDDWRGSFYPDELPRRRWLERYAETFDTVEVNNTFYRLPARSSVAAWAEQTPGGFLFACKASRYLTHVKRLRGIDEGASRFVDALAPLRDAGKLGPILWQLPGNFTRDDARLEAALEAAHEALPGARHGFEFRHPSWFTRPVYGLLADAGAALVIGDDPQRPFVEPRIVTDWTYVRFHRGRRGRRGNYSDAELATWKRRIAGWRRRVKVYAYFNNDWEAFAPRNAMKLL
jgi:uncharacterized protein YecE (DUF72 family)